ncbi:hypothetical protein PTSG_07973 [Salpingoeca rosetta]|uniref:DDE Tnp4 domain-containing protein n=1 Tax=Salpingoeca rosetta (strain ATCC 50818 / BSB-021) TaxID=946362 RepID=F2UGV8_SALR5|nr:uncharacterized protein PTSG_07973 [Salpingoeca rosetta]EGD75858.1 hypothetical protein PTSG_07973 [Salpingoeca rosetta]|eukprot:XP_004991779.1 hypothetical protein PTSG_07973 [Salpingoeca rosetta]
MAASAQAQAGGHECDCCCCCQSSSGGQLLLEVRRSLWYQHVITVGIRRTQEIARETEYWSEHDEYFKGCIGAADRTLYVSAGFEGACHDSFMITKVGFVDRIPTGTYVLFDAGGPLVEHRILVPFKATRYHVSAFTDNPPLNAKEAFNWRHSSKRMRVEQAIGHLKQRFQILAQEKLTCTPERAVDFVLASAALHNYIGAPDDTEWCS